MKKILGRTQYLLILLFVASCVDRPTSYDPDFHDREIVIDQNEGDQKVFTASDKGEILIKTDWDSPPYNEVHFDFEIVYEDDTPVSGAKVYYQEKEDFILIRIEGTQDDGATIIAGTPEEILNLFEQEEGQNMRKSSTFAHGTGENVVASGAILIIAAKILIIKGAKLYATYNTATAIWDTYIEVREVSKFFTDSIKLESGGRLFCRSANDIAGLALDLKNIAKSTGNIVKAFKSPPGAEEIIGDKVYEATFGKQVERIEEYVADFIYDTVQKHFEDYVELAEIPLGIIVYMPYEVRLPYAEGEQPGFMEVYPNHELCRTPQITTNAITNIRPTTATSGGTITDIVGADITQKGICWSTSQNPDINDTCTNEGSGSGSFTSNLTDLSPNTRYYVRAYAENSSGIGYGNQRNFVTKEIIDDVPSEVNEFLTPEQKSTLQDQGLTIYTGLNPPNVEGNYYANSLETADGGMNFVNYSYRYFDQTSDLSIKSSHISENGTDVAEGQGAFIAGTSSTFSVYIESISEIDEGTHIVVLESARIYSGTISAEGIFNFQFGFIITDKQNDLNNNYMNVDDTRVIYETDGLAERVDEFPFSPKVSGTSDNYSIYRVN